MEIAKQEAEITLDGRYYLVKFDSRWLPAEPDAGFMHGGWEIDIESIADYGPITDENESPLAIYSADDFDKNLLWQIEEEIAWNM